MATERASAEERLILLSKVFTRALPVFQLNGQATREWLSTPMEALDGMTPLVCAESESGADQVIKLIERLERGESV